METQEQIEKGFDEKFEHLKRERREALDEYAEKVKALRKPIDDEYWGKRAVLDAQWKTALKKVGLA